MDLWNVDILPQHYMASQPRKTWTQHITAVSQSLKTRLLCVEQTENCKTMTTIVIWDSVTSLETLKHKRYQFVKIRASIWTDTATSTHFFFFMNVSACTISS